MRFKESTIDPAQMLENNTIFVGRQQQQQQESPNLSDIDYSELAAGNQMNSEFRAYRSDIGFGDQQMDNSSYGNYAMPMKRSSTQVGSLGGGSGGSQAMYYPHQTFEQNRMKPFAGSAPSHMGYMYSPFAGSDDVSVSSHSNFTQNNKDPDYDDDYSNQANMQAIMEKRRRRRESHNAVERRRRDNINDRIQELGTLLPDNVDDGINKMNKGTILRKSVEQIKKLQQDVMQYKQRIRDLELVLHQFRQQA
ncbi:HLH-domain-containing protein [Backusella circina FSU 941]|nr:HLH-domain-containing protein [Backusella circina FSU 941]